MITITYSQLVLLVLLWNVAKVAAYLAMRIIAGEYMRERANHNAAR